jgi:hypothetical protein
VTPEQWWEHLVARPDLMIPAVCTVAAMAGGVTWRILHSHYENRVAGLKEDVARERTTRQAAEERLRAVEAQPVASVATERSAPATTAMIPWLRAGAKHTAEDNRRLRRRTQDILKAIDHICQEFIQVIDLSRTREENMALHPVPHVRLARDYGRIRADIFDVRDKLIASVPASVLVSRAPVADEAYKGLDYQDLQIVRDDLAHLSEGLIVDEGYF